MIKVKKFMRGMLKLLATCDKELTIQLKELEKGVRKWKASPWSARVLRIRESIVE